jgi:hypothetical protein
LTNVVTTPERSGGREQAQAMLAELPQDLSNGQVEIHFEEEFVATPSFMDELVREILVERRALALRLVGAPERASSYAEQAAVTRDVADRLVRGIAGE